MSHRAFLAIATMLWFCPVTSVADEGAARRDLRLVPGEGIFLLVRSGSDGISIARVAAARKPTDLAKPSLTFRGWEQHPPGTEELVVSLHDKKGKLLGAYSFPTRRLAFADALAPKGGRLTGGPRGLASVVLPVHVPYPRGAAFLYFFRVLVRQRDAMTMRPPPSRGWAFDGNGPYGPVAYTVEPLGAFPLKPRSGRFVSFDVPDICPPPRLKFRVDFRDLKAIARFDLANWYLGSRPPSEPHAPACPSGAFPSENLGLGTDRATSFNVVILGDGYRDVEMGAFKADAVAVKNALLETNPFDEFKARINVYRIDTPSAESGVDYCPKECPKQVCYEGTNAGRACSPDSDCPGGSCAPEGNCFMGAKAGQPCSPDSDCPGGICDPSAFCFKNNRFGAVCDSDNDCSGGSRCTVTNVCHLGSNAGTICLSNADCPGGTCRSRSWCPPTEPDDKQTALEVGGEASKTGSCTEFTADFAKLADTACSALDPADADLYIVLVNCDAYGGMTYPSEKTVFVAARHAPEMIAHEAAHALAKIGEEYLGGVLPCLSASCTTGCAAPVEFDNVALPAQVASNAVPWFSLTKPSERANGTFATIEHYSPANCHDTIGGTPSGMAQTLGLYWGAQYLEEGTDPWNYGSTCQISQTCRVKVGNDCVTLCYDASCDSRGAAFYRPMPLCTMRFLEEPFCRVCNCALRKVLSAATGLAPSTSWCPASPLPPVPVSDVRRTDTPG